MSISAMKQALEALEWDADYDTSVTLQKAAITALKQAIAEAEKQPVHAVDISQECVDETAKDRHEFEEMVKKGTKAWDGVPDDWVDDLRGGADKQDPHDDIYDVWKEKT